MKRPWAIALAIGFTACAAALAVGRWVLLDFPGSADEFAYLWQAEAMADGHLTGEVIEPADAFVTFHFGVVDGRRYARFPPGWPALLSLGVMAGWPGIVNPLLGAAALACLYLWARAFVGDRAALVGTLLTLSSPFFLLNAGSYHSHISCFLALVAAGLCLDVAWWRAPAPGRRLSGLLALAAGTALGMAAAIRPYTALLLGGPLVVGPLLGRDASRRTRVIRLLPLVVLGALPGLVAYALVNRALTGDPFLPATQLLDPAEGVGFGVHGHSPRQGLQNTLLWLVEAFAYTFFLSPLLLFAARRPSADKARSTLLWLLLFMLPLGYFFYWNPGGFRYGPRFWLEGLIAFAPLIGIGFLRTWALPSRRILIYFGIGMGLIVLGKQLSDAHTKAFERSALYRAVEDAGLDHAVVLLLSGVADMPFWDLTRNPPEWRTQPVLYGRGRGVLDKDVARAHPQRRLFYYRWDESGGRLFPADLDHPEPGVAMPDR